MPEPAMISTANSQPERLTVDVRAQQIAGSYAKAYLNAAQKAGQLDAQVAEFEEFVRDVLNGFPEFDRLLASSLVKHEERLAMLERVFAGRASDLLLDFLKVLSGHDRLNLLREIYRQLRAQYNVLRGRVQVRVSTATPLEPADAEELLPALRTLFKGEPEVEAVVDPALIGGVVLRIGDTVYDGSVARQLEQLREHMINRSVHEIQSRRNSFRSAE
jgi:F-type H+-transporting ATPase subunit delta